MNRSNVLVACALMLSVGAASAQTTTDVAASRSTEGLITDPLASPSNTSNAIADVAGNKKVTVIYDNFNDDPTNLYGTSYAWSVSGSQSNWGSHAMAAAFTPLVDTQVTKIKVAVGSHTSAREVLISL
ncbi:hypothetical protein, partial [Ideonella sp.]|uniref:hypothetical protein n=1 Tax=Ideonella sp. TaxID=1929293 RepID=UPI003BB4DE07